MSTDVESDEDFNCVADAEAEDGTVVLHLRDKRTRWTHSWRYEAFAIMTPDEARELAEELQDAAREAEADA